MKLRALLLLSVSSFLFCFVLGCGSDGAAEKPKIVKGGVDPEKAKAETNTKMGFMK
jgi:hypothetical protein